MGFDTNADGKTDYYLANVSTFSDYGPFGDLLPTRKYSTGDYKYGFNGKESDGEWNSNVGAMYDYGFRIYDPRIAKFLSVDPLTASYPELTPYQFASNTPIWATDLDGMESWYTNDGAISTQTGPFSPEYRKENGLSEKPNPASSSTSGGGSKPILRNNSGSSGSAVNNTAASIGAVAGVTSIQASIVRLKYASKVAQLEPLGSTNNINDKILGSTLRNKFVVEARNTTPEPYLSIAKDLKGELKLNPEGRFWVSNGTVNAKMVGVGLAGRALTGYAAYNSLDNISNAENKSAAAVEEAGAWAGALYLGSKGAAIGAGFGGPLGAAVVGLGGGAIGGILGRSGAELLTQSDGPRIGIRTSSFIQQGDNTRVGAGTGLQ